MRRHTHSVSHLVKPFHEHSRPRFSLLIDSVYHHWHHEPVQNAVFQFPRNISMCLRPRARKRQFSICLSVKLVTFGNVDAHTHGSECQPAAARWTFRWISTEESESFSHLHVQVCARARWVNVCAIRMQFLVEMHYIVCDRRGLSACLLHYTLQNCSISRASSHRAPAVWRRCYSRWQRAAANTTHLGIFRWKIILSVNREQ